MLVVLASAKVIPTHHGKLHRRGVIGPSSFPSQNQRVSFIGKESITKIKMDRQPSNYLQRTLHVYGPAASCPDTSSWADNCPST